MANTLGTIGAAVIAQEALPLLVAQFPILKEIATDFSNEPVLAGQSVVSRIPSVGSFQSFDDVNGYVPADSNLQDVTVTLNNFSHSSFYLTDRELSSTNVNLIDTLAKSAAAEIGLGLMSGVAALVTSGNYASATTQALSGVTRNTIIAANTKLNKRNVGKERFGIFNADMYGQLKQDANLISTFFGGFGVSPTDLPVIDGIKCSEYSALPSTGNLQGVIAAKDAFMLAARVPSDAGFQGLPLNGKISVVSDEKTGLSVMVREFYDIQRGRRNVTFTLIWGVAVGNPAALERIVTA